MKDDPDENQDINTETNDLNTVDVKEESSSVKIGEDVKEEISIEKKRISKSKRKKMLAKKLLKGI